MSCQCSIGVSKFEVQMFIVFVKRCKAVPAQNQSSHSVWSAIDPSRYRYKDENVLCQRTAYLWLIEMHRSLIFLEGFFLSGQAYLFSPTKNTNKIKESAHNVESYRNYIPLPFS